MAVLPVIIAGGKGERLWPLSTPVVPKPFFRLSAGELSLFQKAVRRSQFVPGALAPLIVCNIRHRELVRQQAVEAGLENPQLLIEEVGRNTGPAICAAAVHAEQRGLGNVPMLVLAADHEILELNRFKKACTIAAQAAEQGEIVLFAIEATAPSTAYGYLRISAGEELVEVLQFVEKPDTYSAQGFLTSGDYAWNSGMFCFTAENIVRVFAELQPDMLSACRESQVRIAATDVVFEAERFSQAPAVSIDYAIMEKLKVLKAVRADIGWSDLGDWAALHGLLHRGDHRVTRHGHAGVEQCRNALFISTWPQLFAIGVQELVLVATERALLLVALNDTQQVRTIPLSSHSFVVVNHLEQDQLEVPWPEVKAVVALGLGHSCGLDELVPDWQEAVIVAGKATAGGGNIFARGQLIQRQPKSSGVTVSNNGGKLLGILVR